MEKAILSLSPLAFAIPASCGSTRSSVLDCPECGLTMGSPGCCQEHMADGAAQCACGEVKGSDAPCDETAARWGTRNSRCLLGAA